MSQAKPSCKSSIIQTLLIASVVFLAVNLFLGRNQGPEITLPDAKKNYEAAVTADDSAKIIEAGRVYAGLLEENGAAQSLAEARDVKLRIGEETREEVKTDANYNLAVTSYNELQKIYLADPQSEAGKKAKAEMEKTAELGRQAASTSVGYRFVDMVVGWFGGKNNPGFSYWFAGVFLAIIVRLVVWPLSNKQMIGIKRMQLLQPMLKDLQSKYKGPELQERTMKLYARYGINPMASCLPLLITMPVFFWVFMAMGSYRFDFINGTFLWINEASAAANPGIFAPNLGEMDVPLVILYGISMVVQALISVNDPATAKQARMIGIGTGLLFTVLFLTVLPYPSAFLIYWITSNILTSVQSFMVSRMPIPPLVEKTDEQMKKSPLFGGLTPKDGPTANGNNSISSAPKTGAPVLHKSKGGKQKKKR
ncbi:MAG: YidC/Oxa1 family membrane protein insertase [Armatimonadota bacterium]|nr:YidC/Oxa1 family membrane protein insertase [Armatimonadota bacterium]